MYSDTILGQLSKRQLKAFNKLSPLLRSIIYWKMGEGKTRIALALAEYHLKSFPSICLVICRRKAFDTWREELLKVGVKWMVREYPDQCGVSNSKTTVWLVSHAMLHKIYQSLNQYPIELIIYDELYLYSNHKSRLSNAAVSLCRNLFEQAKITALSGTIMSAGNNLSVFNQSRAVGISHVLASSLSSYLSTFQTFFNINYGHGNTRQYRNKPGSFQKITDRIRPYCDFYFPTFSNSRIHEIDISVELSSIQKNYIERLKEEYFIQVEEMGLEKELRSTLELVHMVSKISNGYIETDQGIKTLSCPKIEALNNKIEEVLGNESKCVVWCYYQSDIDYLRSQIKHPTLVMSGKHEFDRAKWKTGKVNVVLATVGIGSSFNDFAQIEYAFYYSSSYKMLDMEQSKFRSRRKDSKHKTSYYYYFTSKHTFDSAILKASRTNEQTQNDFIKLCRNSLVSI